MSVKNVLLIALVLVNLLLAAGVVLQLYAPRSADAQVLGGGFDYAVVTARLQGSEDGVWVLNLRTRKLSVLRLPQGENQVMRVIDSRDLLRDLRGEAGRP